MTENVVNHYAERRANENTPTTPSDLQEDLRMTTTSMLDTRDGVVAIWKKGGFGNHHQDPNTSDGVAA